MDTIKKVAQAYLDMLEAKKKKTDEVDPNELKKDFDDREDKDIDNDGDTDKSDEYLHNRRKTVKKAIGDDKKDVSSMEENVETTADNHRKLANMHKEKMLDAKDEDHRDGMTAHRMAHDAHKAAANAYDKASDEHKALGAKMAGQKAHQASKKANGMFEGFADYTGYEVKGWEVVQENEDGTFDAFINGELHRNISEEKAKELKHSNVQQKNPEGQEKLEPRAKGEKDFKDQHTVDKKDEEQTVGVDTKGMDGGVKKAPARTGDKAQAETMQSVPKTTGQ